MRSLMGLMVVACLTGCATTTSVATGPTQVPWSYPRPEVRTAHVYLDDKLSPVERHRAEDAVHQWNVALDGVLTLQIVQGIPTSLLDLAVSRECSDILIFSADFDNPMIQRSHVEHTTALTMPFGSRRPGALIYLVANYVHPNTVLHEIGHALGARDREAGGLLMSQTYERRREITYVDADAAAQVARWYH